MPYREEGAYSIVRGASLARYRLDGFAVETVQFSTRLSELGSGGWMLETGAAAVEEGGAAEEGVDVVDVLEGIG